ncbi:MAG TPA: NAD(P)-dependent oxidoreductase [Candidatus Dormibacteraeota bacterium]|nr:NAD(P)-dependent oxidoreductase [Candidatus Dormibacteraeota bacterium]
MQPVGLIGVGNMGSRIGRRILDHGVTLIGHDLDATRMAAAGIPAAAGVAELVERVEIVLLSLPDSPAIEAVARGGDGLLAHVRPGQVVVDLSTAHPASTRALHEEFAGRGVEFLDAGISGGAAAAEKGTLTLMVGGAPEALDRVRWLLETFSRHIYHMGGSGAGHTTKVLNNFLNGVALAATAEVMVAARRAGLDLKRFLEVVNHGSGVNYATLNRFPHIVEGDYLEGGLTGKLMAKDLKLYLDLVDRLGVPSLTGPGCLAAFQVAIGLGYGDVISNHVVDALGDLAGGVRLCDGRA